MHIALFNFWWPFKIYTRDFARSLAAKGHTVHIFVMRTQFNDARRPRNTKNLHLHEFSFTGEQEESLHALAMMQLAAQGYKDVARESAEYLLMRLQLDLPHMAAFAHSMAPEIELGLGVEKGGLLWAEAWHEKTAKPYLYYSLELYSRDSVGARNAPVQAMLALEPKAHASAAATIIQDRDRADYLFHYNGTPPGKVFYFPISVRNIPARDAGNSAAISPPLPSANFWRKIFMYFGMINGRMSEQELLSLYWALPEGYMLHFHMHAQDYLQSMKQRYGLRNLRVTTDDLDDSGIANLVSRARIGLCWYAPTDCNNALTAFSSEKLALYLRHGIPVIVNANSNFGKLFAKFRCGEALCHVAQLPGAIAAIEAGYDAYRRAAFAAYEHFFNHDTNFEKVYAQLVTEGIIE